MPWITVADVTGLTGMYLTSTKSMLTKEGAERTRVLEIGTVLLTNSGATLGVPAIMNIQAGANDGIAALLNLRNVHPEYLCYFLDLRTKYFRETLAPGVGQPNLNTDLIANVVGAFPSVCEQEHIARIIAAWDQAESICRKAVKARRDLKRGLMQQLLTGKRRFPEFGDEPWVEHHLGDLFDERNETQCVNLPLLSITANRGIIYREEVEKKDSSNSDKGKYKRIVPGDIGYNTMRMWQGVSALSSLEGIVSPAYTICIPGSQMDGDFAKHLFKFPPVVHRFYRHSQGLVSDTWNLKFHNFAQVKVTVPRVEEQRQIASVFDTLDHEIASLTQQREALQKQKKGLMQQLLTGKVRVPIDATT